MSEVLTPNSYFLNPYAFPVLATGLILFLLGIFTITKNRHAIGSIAFLTASLSMAGWLIFYSFCYMSTSADVAVFWARIVWSWAVYIGSAIYFFTHSVLETLEKKKKWVIAQFAISTAFLPFIHNGGLFLAGVSRHFWGYYSQIGPIAWVFLAFFYWQMIASFVAYYQRYRAETVPVIKRQIGMVALSFLVAYTATVDYFPAIGIEAYPFGYLSMFGFACVLFYTMARYRLLDIKTALHKTLMWLVTSAIFVGPLLAFIFIYSDVFIRVKTWHRALAIAILFLVMAFYLKVVQPHIDHFFQKKRYIAQNVTDAFLKNLAALDNVKTLIENLVKVIQNVLYTQKMSVYILDSKIYHCAFRDSTTTYPTQLSPHHPFLKDLAALNAIVQRDHIHDRNLNLNVEAADAYFKDMAADLCVPFMHNGELVALLNLGEKVNLKSYSALDLELLSRLRAQGSIALSNALIYSTLEQKVADRTLELKEANERLQELDRLKNDLFANISHEFRTPLTTIRSILAQMLDDLHKELGNTYDDVIATAVSNTDRLLVLINGILDLTKLQQGTLELNLAPTVLPTQLRDIVRRHQPYPGKKPGIRFQVEGPDAFPTLYLDQAKLDTIISNLLGNAFKFSPDGCDDIEVILRDETDAVTITVRDHGEGIPANKVDRVFERFFQATEKSAKGTGLGLSMVKGYTELHQGSVSVTSILGEGTEFTLTFRKGTDWFKDLEHARIELPKTTTEDEKVSALLVDRRVNIDEIYRDMPRIEGRDMLLVMDDEPDVAATLRRLLKEEYNLIFAKDGQEGLQKVRAHKPDMVLSDVMMKPMGGFEFLRRLRVDEAIKDIPVIMLTAAQGEQNLIIGFEAGARDYIQKPFLVDELKMRIKNQLTMIHDRRRIARLNGLLIQSEKMASLATYAGSVAHNIRNMILPLQASLDVIQMDAHDIHDATSDKRDALFTNFFTEVDESVVNAQSAINDIDELIRLLLDIYKTDTKKIEVFDVIPVIEQAMRLEKMRHAFDNIQIDLQKMGEDFTLEAAKGLVSSVMVEFLKNAGDAIAQQNPQTKGHVWISIAEACDPDLGPVLHFSIKDDGCGMSEEVKKEIFAPLFTTKAAVGTGLGLTSVYEMVKMQNGTIEVESAVGKGTTFIVMLPKRRKQPGSVEKTMPLG